MCCVDGQMRIVKQRLREMMPALCVFLDVSCLLRDAQTVSYG